MMRELDEQQTFALYLNPQLQSGEKVSFVWVAPTRFIMGANLAESSGPNDDLSDAPFEVELTTGYWISQYPVTQSQWTSVFPANRSYFQGSDLPIESISWHEARLFCEQLTKKYREMLPYGSTIDLPTEAQWEFACSAGRKETACSDGLKAELLTQAWFADNSGGKTHTVGSKKANALGLFDMLGNVLEWCRDGAEDYPVGYRQNWEGADTFNKIVRGGCWATHYPSELLTPFGRGYIESDNVSKYCGFRLVIHLPV